MTDAKNFTLPEGREESSIEFIRASRLDEGVVLEGTYLESIPNPLNNEKLDFKFETEDGSIKVVNGAGNLGYKMKYISAGDYVQVTYRGKQEITKGSFKGKEAHNFEVLTAE